MKNFRIFILLLVVVVSGLVACGLWSRPKVQPVDSESFSAECVVLDIENIAQKHHSVAHPEQRKEVREYLVSRLEGLGADSVTLFEYKGLEGPENKHVKYTFDATNILAHFSPKGGQAKSNLLFIAHYDSRYSQIVPPRDTVWSYGAADDGYGIGVILETLRQVLPYRDSWHQGVKVLFTDAEEVGMMGMKAMWASNREQFEDVGFVVNLEARGPNGPVLLFETSAGNERVMELYDAVAEYPFTYSLTTVVYSFMPNFTDFTIIKDTLPGVNFSTIADINHYHTDKDNIGTINPKSIQHYGAQVVPMVREYLCNSKYADKGALCGEQNRVCFTIPLLGLFNFSATAYMWVNIALFVLCLALIALDVVRGRVTIGAVVRSAGKVLLGAIVVLLLGVAATYLCCLISGVPFKLFGVIQGITFDNVAMVVLSVVMVAAVVMLYATFRGKKVNKITSLRQSAKAVSITAYATTELYGAVLTLLVITTALLFALGENMMFFIPFAVAVLAMILYRITTLKLWLVLGIGVVLLHAISFLYALSMALTIGAFGVVAMIAFFDVVVVVPMADIYLLKK